jgi:protein TonB
VSDNILQGDTGTNFIFQAVFKVHADGTADVSLLKGTGNNALDKLALEAAKQWTFKPATVDGKAVESYLRLRVNFDLS